MYIFVDSAKKQMVKLEQHGNNNDVAVIAIKEYKENQDLDANNTLNMKKNGPKKVFMIYRSSIFNIRQN